MSKYQELWQRIALKCKKKTKQKAKIKDAKLNIDCNNFRATSSKATDIIRLFRISFWFVIFHCLNFTCYFFGRCVHQLFIIKTTNNKSSIIIINKKGKIVREAMHPNNILKQIFSSLFFIFLFIVQMGKENSKKA